MRHPDRPPAPLPQFAIGHLSDPAALVCAALSLALLLLAIRIVSFW